MNTLQKTLLALTVGTFMTAGAQAAVNYGNGMTAQPYVGAKVGQYDLDFKGADKATSYGVYGGAKFTPNFGIEGEYLTTGDADAYDDSMDKGEYSADTYGIYGTAEYAVPNTNGLYGKGRLGVAKNKVEVNEVRKATGKKYNYDHSGAGVAGGLGLGYNIASNASIEAMYNWYPTIDVDKGDDIDASGITLGAHFKF